MKKIVLYVSIAILLFLVSGIATFFILKNTDKPKASISNKITSFEYSFGSYFGGYYDYQIYQEGNKYIFIGNGKNGVDLSINETIDRSVLDDIQKIIQKYDVKKWNGFNKSNKNILDGHSFSLFVKYDDHKIRAHGYMKYPDNYKLFQEEIIEYFDTLVNNLKKG